MPRSFEAVFGFAPPSAGEREALRMVGGYLRRVGSALGSREVSGAIGPGLERSGRTGTAVDPVMRLAVRESVEATASFCDGLLDAVERPPDGAAAPSGVERPPGA